MTVPVTFKIEKKVPVPTGATTVKNEVLEQKISKLLEEIKPTDSFVFPKENRYYVDKILKRDFKEYLVKIKATDNTKKFFRLWRIQ